MKKGKTSPQRAANSPRKQKSHYDGEIVEHPDGTFTYWLDAQGMFGEFIAKAARKLGITRQEFVRRAVLYKVEAFLGIPCGDK